MTSPFRPDGASDANHNGANHNGAQHDGAQHDATAGREVSPWAPGGGGAGGGGEQPAPTSAPAPAPTAASAQPWAGAAWTAPQPPQSPHQQSPHQQSPHPQSPNPQAAPPPPNWGAPRAAPPGGPWGSAPPTPGSPLTNGATPLGPLAAPPLGPLAAPSGYADPYRSPTPPRAGTRRRRLAAAAVAIALVSAGVGGAVGAVVADDNSTTVVTSTQERNGSGLPGTSPAADDTVSAAAKAILPSTVTIAHEAGAESGTGSGVIIRTDGHILTNNHVVAGPSGGTLTVVLPDGRVLGATVVGTDPSSDLAVIKVDASDLPAATFGDSEALSIGELVVAVGSPLGLNGTVTSGIVSSVHRPVRTGDSADQNAVLDAIQTDAPINPGNSGGPLVNSNGEVVGINSAIASVGGGLLGQQQAGNIGVGFAIPSNFAEEVSTELIDDGAARHPYLGVSATTAGGTGPGAVLIGSGAEIRDLVRNGPAERAGLQPSDVVTKLGDRQVTDVDGLIAAVRSHQIGETVTVTYQRDGVTSTVAVTLDEQRG